MSQMQVWLERHDGGAAIVRAEVVHEAFMREQGLAGYHSLGDDTGMLLMFDAEDHHRIWMHGVSFPLDIIFIRERGFGQLDVVGIVCDAQPWSTELLRADQPSLYVLEVNGGWCRRNRVDVGARVRFE